MIENKSILNKFVNLNNTKVIPTKNKKIISTCLYIPSNLSYNERSIYYFQGLVKSVETFDSVMNTNAKDRWIYRIYYDKMFDNGINFRFNINKKTKKMTSKQKRVEMKRRKLILSKKKKHSTNEYKYAYNGGIYEGGPSNIQEALAKYKDSLKKLLKLYHLYLKQIKNNKDNRYKNIELVSYDCPAIKLNPEFIGHSSSFGMFLRFTPILDANVDLFYSVNSTHPITPQLKIMLDKWVSNGDEKAFCFAYQTPNVIGTSKKYIVEPFEAIKNKQIGNIPLTSKETGFVEIVDQMFKLYSLANSNKELLTLDNSDKDEIKDENNNSIKYNFNRIKKKKSSTKRKTKHLLDSVYNFKNLLYNKGGRNLDIAIGGGMFGFKKDFPMLSERYNVFLKYINYLISHQIQLEYGLDELILKTILLPDLYIYSDNIYSVNVVNIRELSPFLECSSSILQLKQHSTTESYVFDAHGTKIYFNSELIYKMPHNIFSDHWLIQVDVFDSRAMYRKEDGTILEPNELLVLKIDEDDLGFNSLFVSFNEPKKLLVLDNNLLKHKLTNFKEEFIDTLDIEYIHKYDTNSIYKLLKRLVEYYK